jgi:hypothetical protein
MTNESKTDNTKQCNCCGLIKKVTEFAPNPSNKKDGRAAKCHKCHGERYNRKPSLNLLENAYVWPG